MKNLRNGEIRRTKAKRKCFSQGYKAETKFKNKVHPPASELQLERNISLSLNLICRENTQLFFLMPSKSILVSRNSQQDASQPIHFKKNVKIHDKHVCRSLT